MLTGSLRRLSALCLIGAFAAVTAAAQQAPEPQPASQAAPPPAARQRRPMPPPSNLKVLPKDMTAQQVVAIMRGYEKDLGVECEYCHAKDPATGRNNFASDANPMKDRARVMMRMTHVINTEYLTQLTDPKPEHEVSCGTCHRGMAKPAVFVPPAREHPATPPAAAPAPPAGR